MEMEILAKVRVTGDEAAGGQDEDGQWSEAGAFLRGFLWVCRSFYPKDG